MAKYNRIDFIDNNGTVQNILHTGNKPSGSYTGNGDATQRVISTGTGVIGANYIVRAVGSNKFAIVTPEGNICAQGSGNNATSIGGVWSSSSGITIATDSALFNASGVTYEYSAI